MVRSYRVLVAAAASVFLGTLGARTVATEDTPRELQPFGNPAGNALTITTGNFDPDNAFFQSLGTNGRSCATCHQASDGWTVTPAHLQQRFDASDGFDPIFRLNDGANCSTADISTPDARRGAFSLLLSKGLIRVALPIPANAEFSVVDMDDPYGCSTGAELSLYRRPLPATNLKFLSAVMWDGRETQAGMTMEANFRQQAIDATLGHAQAFSQPSDEQLQQIIDFETHLFTAQITDNSAKRLDDAGAKGGPVPLSGQQFFLGINDPIGLNPTGAAFDPRVFNIFDAWQGLQSGPADLRAVRRSIARGQEIFNTRTINITGVRGLNDVLAQASISGTCTTCHDSPNAGNHSIAMALDIGMSDESRRTPDLPLYTLRCNATGELIKTSDPGRAMISGKCADIGKMKGPVLRALASRAPYFHNGTAATLDEVVKFYDQRFKLNLSPKEKADLTAFLKTL
jgi:cytochrome c peroxidase